MRVLITGASGFIGSHLGRTLSATHTALGTTFRSRAALGFPTRVVDITQERAVADLVREFRPEVIFHAAACSRVLACETDPAGARTINVDATGCLSRWAARIKARLIFLSSDQVFSGRKGGYIESDLPHPINEYGRTKLTAEQIVMSSSSGNLVVRSNSVVGASHGHGESFSDWILGHLKHGEPISLFADQYRSPIHIRTLVQLLTDVCVNPISGVIHAGGPRRMSRADLGFLVARSHGLPPDPINLTSVNTHPQASIMTRDTSYGIARLRQLVPALPLRSLDEEFIQDEQELGQTT